LSKEKTMPRTERLGYIALNVLDLKRSTEFWTKAVHLEVSARQEGKVFLRGGTAHHWIVLQQAETAGLARVGIEMNSPADIDVMEQRLRDMDVDVESGYGWADARVGRYLRFRDPSGNPLELFADMVTMGMPPRPKRVQLLDIQHIVLNVHDTQTAVDFYSNVLEMRVSDWLERSIAFLHFRNGWHHGIGLGGRGLGAWGLNHICFQPPDLDNTMRARAVVQKLGLPITMDLLKHSPSGSIGFYFAGEDTVVEFSYGAKQFAEDEQFKPRIIAADPLGIDVWKAGVNEIGAEDELVEELRRRAQATVPARR
jgi:catechol 2,3-dioxygenase-like lactoylglutathione lyase family enzyme